MTVDYSSKKFSVETRQKLERAGFLIYQLTGVSIRELKDQRLGIDLLGLYDEKEYPFLTVPSLRSQVALKPKKWVIRKKDWSAVTQFSEELTKELGVEDINIDIGSAATYIELILQHFDRTGQGQYLLRGKDRIDTTSYVGKFQYRLGSGFGYSDPVSKFACLTAPSSNYIVCVDHHCRCHPVHTGFAPIIMPK
jgi:hypothetical protein